MITKAPILSYYNQGLKTIVETNSFDYVSSRIFFQLEKNELLYPITFFSKNLNHVECNYKIYNKEIPGFIQCFKQ